MQLETPSPNIPTEPPNTWLGNYMETVRVALPVSLSLLGQIAMGTTDVIFVGKLGALELAASSLAVHVYFVMFILCSGIIISSNSLISQFYGKNDGRMIRRTVRQALWIGILLSCFGWTFLWNMEALMLLLGQDPDVAHVAGRYMGYFMWSLLPAVGFVALRSFCIALQKPQTIAWITWIAVPINAFLDYVLIFGDFGIPAMNIEGAGLATALVTIGTFLAITVVILLKSPFKEYQIFANFWRPDWMIFRKLFKLGTPLAIRLTLEESVFAVSAILIGWIGVVELAAHSIVITVLSISFMISVGIGDAVTSRVGYEFGARNYLQTKKNGWAGVAVVATFMAIYASMITIFPAEIAGIILEEGTTNATDVLLLATTLIVVAAFTQIPDGIQIVVAGSLTGLNDTKFPMYNALIAYWGIGFTAAWILAFEMGMGVIGFWIGLFIGLVINAACNTLRFWWISRTDARLDAQQLLTENNNDE